MLFHPNKEKSFEQQTAHPTSAGGVHTRLTNRHTSELLYVGLEKTSLILMLGYGLIAIYNFYFLPPPHNELLFGIAGLLSAFFLVLFLVNRKFSLPSHVTHLIFILICIVTLANVMIQCVLLTDEKYLTYFILITTGVSLAFYSWRLLFGFYILVLASFTWTLQFIQPMPDYTHQFFVMGCSLLIGFLSVTLRKNALGHLIATRALAESRSERLAVALEESQRGIQAQQDNHSKSNFLAHMSHELRTPLTAIIGFSEIIKQKMFGALENDRYADYVVDIHASSEHLLSLVNDILDLSKLEENMVEVNLVTVDLGKTLERCLSMMRERARQREISLQYIPSQSESDISCDPLRLKQIILNLLSNAIKFTCSGGLVTLEVHKDGDGNLAIEVRDTGVGMSGDEIKNAMEPFWQAKAYRSSPTEGTGLGLALSKELALLLGGDLEIESQPEVGTTVRFSLPRKAIEAPIK